LNYSPISMFCLCSRRLCYISMNFLLCQHNFEYFFVFCTSTLYLVELHLIFK